MKHLAMRLNASIFLNGLPVKLSLTFSLSNVVLGGVALHEKYLVSTVSELHFFAFS